MYNLSLSLSFSIAFSWLARKSLQIRRIREKNAHFVICNMITKSPKGFPLGRWGIGEKDAPCEVVDIVHVEELGGLDIRQSFCLE